MKKANGLKKSFSTTIIIWMVVLSTLPLLGFSAFAFITYDRIMYQNFMQRTEDVVEGTRNLISNELQVFEDQLYEMSLDDNIIRMLKSDTLTPDDARYLNQIMHTVLGQKSNMVYIRLIQIEGDFQYSNYIIPSLYNINAYRDWGIYRHVQQDGYDAVYLNHYKHPNGRSNAMSVIRTIEDQGEPLGYLVLDVSKEYIQQIITSQPRPSIGTVRYIITSKQGHVVYNDSQYLGDNAFMGLSLQQSKITVDNESMYAENFIFESLDSRFDIYFYGIVFKDVFTDNTGLFRPVLITIVIILALISGVMGYILSKRVVKPIVALSDTMKTIRSGDVTLDLPTKREDEIDEIRYQFMNMMQRIQGYHLQDLEKQDLLRRTEIKSLQSQINPHFLYNTLDSIKWMAKLEKVDAIPEIVTELGELLQRGMNVEETIVSVSEEVSIIKSYIFIQKIRYQDRFDYILDIEPNILDYQMPKFILQPLVENAIVHGIESSSAKGTIEIRGWSDEEKLYFTVRDTGKGFDFDVHQYIEQNKLESIGLSNVNRRLELHYGDNFGLMFESARIQGALIFIWIPKTLKKETL